MTDDITKNLTDSEKLDFLINAVSDTNRRLIALEERQTALEQLVHARLYDTRPLWQAVVQQIEQVNARLDRIEARLDRVEARLDQMDARFDRMDARLDQTNAHLKRHDEKFTQVLQQLAVLNDDVLLVRAGHRELRERVALLEAA